MTDAVPLVRVVRSGLEESVHLGHVAVCDADGRLVARVGDPSRPVFARSSLKPLQASVSLFLAGEPPPEREIAVMCASHNAEPVHLEQVRSLLRRAGLEEAALRCTPAFPLDPDEAARSGSRSPILSDCSGKHAGFLLACVRAGLPTDSYLDPDHPVQVRVGEAVVAATGEGGPARGTDGCGAPVFGVPLRAMATMYARLVRPERLDALREPARLSVSAMRAEPYLVAGRNRVCTAVMQALDGVVVKAGAEALLCAGLADRGLGIAVKILDGSARATAPAFLHVLRLLDAASDDELERLSRFARPPVLGGGRPVGEMVPGFDLTSI